MELTAILSKTDHTLLSPAATREQILQTVEDAIAFGCASACIPACFVKEAKAVAGGRTKICTVIGFPTGCATAAAKVFETREAVADGADEIDMVMRIGALKEGRDDVVLEDIKAVRRACEGKVLKVIVETCLLTQEEKIRACEIVSRSGADFIKTSTGFSTGGATHEDILLMRKYAAPHLKIKAAGGISSLEDAAQYIREGADRLGTSRIVKTVKEINQNGNTTQQCE